MKKYINIIFQVLSKMILTAVIYKYYGFEVAVLYLLLENWAVNYARNILGYKGV